jgi:hypothetical protein
MWEWRAMHLGLNAGFAYLDFGLGAGIDGKSIYGLIPDEKL